MYLGNKQFKIALATFGIVGVTLAIVLPITLTGDDEEIITKDLNSKEFAETKAKTDAIIQKLRAAVPIPGTPTYNSKKLIIKTNGEMTVIYGIVNGKPCEFKMQKDAHGIYRILEANVEGNEMHDHELTAFNAANVSLFSDFLDAFQANNAGKHLPVANVFEYQKADRTTLSTKTNLFKVKDKYYTTLAKIPDGELDITSRPTPANPPTLTVDGKTYTRYTKAAGGTITTPAFFPSTQTVSAAGDTPASKMPDSVYMLGEKAYQSDAEALTAAGYEATTVVTEASPQEGDTITLDGVSATYYDSTSALNPSGVTPGVAGFYIVNTRVHPQYKKTGTTKYFSTKALALGDAGISTETPNTAANFHTAHPTVSYFATGSTSPITYRWTTNFNGVALTTPGLFLTQPTTAGETPFTPEATLYTFNHADYTQAKARDESIKINVANGQTIATPTSTSAPVTVDGEVYTSTPVSASHSRVERAISIY